MRLDDFLVEVRPGAENGRFGNFGQVGCGVSRKGAKLQRIGQDKSLFLKICFLEQKGAKETKIEKFRIVKWDGQTGQ